MSLCIDGIDRAFFRIAIAWLALACGPLAAAAPDAGPWLQEAESALAAVRPAQALLLLQRALAADPALADAQPLIGRLAETLGQEAADLLRAPAPGITSPQPFLQDLQAWLAADAGRDSNINSGTDATAIAIPALDNRVLPLTSELLTAMPSGFAGLRAGAALPYALSPRTRFWLRGEGAWRVNSAQTAYLPHRYAFSASLRHGGDAIEGGIDVYRKDQWVSRFEVLHEQGIGANASLPLTATIRIMGLADWHESGYPQFLDVTTRGHRLGLGVEGQLAGSGTPRFLLVAQGGPDRASGAIHDLDRRSTELALAASWSPQDGQELRVRVWHGRMRYDAESLLFLRRRLDRVDGMAAEWAFAIAKGWTLTPKLAVERGASNISLYAFSRKQWSLELRRDWR